MSAYMKCSNTYMEYLLNLDKYCNLLNLFYFFINTKDCRKLEYLLNTSLCCRLPFDNIIII